MKREGVILCVLLLLLLSVAPVIGQRPLVKTTRQPPWRLPEITLRYPTTVEPYGPDTSQVSFWIDTGGEAPAPVIGSVWLSDSPNGSNLTKRRPDVMTSDCLFEEQADIVPNAWRHCITDAGGGVSVNVTDAQRREYYVCLSVAGKTWIAYIGPDDYGD